ncbi:MAG: putative phosphatase [uncultured bacterium (gcode 4)]|uniref:Putative phosphatase n=1 Tax=uncultured bacterium (gcode 4) TaxID=1234023 RepID=K2FYV4_9BACT|nr:MAG: putative phosphatase [uncultured bacterium (gcode 4)]
MYKHIIWDFDGTLFDSYPVMANAYKKALAEINIHESLEDLLMLMKISVTHLIDYSKEKYGIDQAFINRFDQYRLEMEAKDLVPFSYADELCKKIHLNGQKNYLYTHRDQSAIAMLKSFEMIHYFSDFIIMEDNFKRKPYPDALLHLLTKYQIDPTDAIMIGDREIDILAAKNAGIASCFYSDIKAMKCDIADFSVSDFKQLEDLLLSI